MCTWPVSVPGGAAVRAAVGGEGGVYLVSQRFVFWSLPWMPGLLGPWWAWSAQCVASGSDQALFLSPQTHHSSDPARPPTRNNRGQSGWAATGPSQWRGLGMPHFVQLHLFERQFAWSWRISRQTACKARFSNPLIKLTVNWTPSEFHSTAPDTSYANRPPPSLHFILSVSPSLSWNYRPEEHKGMFRQKNRFSSSIPPASPFRSVPSAQW